MDAHLERNPTSITGGCELWLVDRGEDDPVRQRFQWPKWGDGPFRRGGITDTDGSFVRRRKRVRRDKVQRNERRGANPLLATNAKLCKCTESPKFPRKMAIDI